MSEVKAKYTITKRCPRCGRTLLLTLEYWYRNRSLKDGLSTWCRVCMQANYHRVRRIVIDAYGGRCMDCGEENIDVLETDHVNGGGDLERRQRMSAGYTRGNIQHLYSEHRRTGKWPKGIAIRCHPCHVRVGVERRLNRKQKHRR
jgi:hypothetical protein